MKSGQLLRVMVLMVIAMFFIVASAPIAAPLDKNSTENTNGTAIHKNAHTASCCQNSSQAAFKNGSAACQANTKQETAKPAATKTNNKSVLDAEVLESPFSFFKDYAAPDKEGDAAPQPNAIIMTAKALAAILLSTIL